eukprot:5124623-Amphidinium_carterae.1
MGKEQITKAAVTTAADKGQDNCCEQAPRQSGEEIFYCGGSGCVESFCQGPANAWGGSSKPCMPFGMLSTAASAAGGVLPAQCTSIVM